MKHIIRQTKSISLICAVIALLVTCQNPDTPSTFTKPAETRLSEAVNKYYDALCNSKEGWVLEYEDSTLRLGRYSFAMKFKTSGEVEVISDIPSQSDIRVGYYTLNIGNTVELSFSTYTQWHYLSDTEIGIYGKGLGADFGFLLTDISADGNTITMKQRAGEHKTAYLKKITSSFQEVKDRYVAQASISARLSLSITPDPRAFFLMLKDPSGARMTEFQFEYDSVFRTVYLQFSLGDIKDTTIEFAVMLSRDGFLLVNTKLPASFPLKSLNFTWDNARKVFVNSELYTIEYGKYTDFHSEARINKKYSNFKFAFSKLKYTHLVWNKHDSSVIEVFDASSPAAQALLTDSIKSVSMYFLSNLTRVVVRFFNVARDFSRYDTFDIVYPKPATGGALFVRIGRGYSSADAEIHFTTTPSGQHADALSDLFASPEGLLIEEFFRLFKYSNRTYRITFFENPNIYFIAYGSSAK